LYLIFSSTGDANQCMRVSSALEAGTVRDHLPLFHTRLLHYTRVRSNCTMLIWPF
jgi:hypothetical protein